MFCHVVSMMCLPSMRVSAYMLTGTLSKKSQNRLGEEIIPGLKLQDLGFIPGRRRILNLPDCFLISSHHGSMSSHGRASLDFLQISLILPTQDLSSFSIDKQHNLTFRLQKVSYPPWTRKEVPITQTTIAQCSPNSPSPQFSPKSQSIHATAFSNRQLRVRHQSRQNQRTVHLARPPRDR